MDPLSFAASLSSLAAIAFQLVSYIGSVKDGGEERKKLGTQLTTLWMVLQQLQTQFATDLASSDQSWTERLEILQRPGGVLTQIGEELKVLQAKLQSKTGSHKLLQSLRWPLDKADVDRAIQQIFQLHQLLIGVLGQVNIALAQEIRKDGAEVKEVIVGDELGALLDWISPLNFLQRQQLIFKEARTGTGKWFQEDDHYMQWEQDSGSILWCPGIPGAGKSFLSSIVIDRLQTLQKTRTDQKIAVLIIYFAFDDPSSQSPELILGSLLKQVLQHCLEVPQELRTDFRKHRNDGTRPSHEEIITPLEKALAQFDRIYVVMDALDELLEERKRRELVEAVTDLNEKLNLMVTSRPIESIRRIFSSDMTICCDYCEDREPKPHEYYFHCVDCEETYLSFDLCQACYDKGVATVSPKHLGHEFVKTYHNLSIEILARDEDLTSYVEWRIEGHDSLKRCVDKKIDLRVQVLQRVIESAQGMFLLARFHMDSLVTKLTPKAILKALETLPTETDTTYEKAMQRINDMNPDFREKAKLFLMWVAYTYRPLNIREIEHATTLLAGETEIDTDEIIPAKVLASMCAGLVIIDEMENVRLCHYTVENYFEKVRAEVFVNTGVCLAHTCLTYLLLDEFGEGRCADRDFDQRCKAYPLLGYASSNWGRHAVEADDPSIEEQVLVFLKSDPHRDAATQAIWHLDATGGYKNWEAKSGATGLHLSSYFGMAKAVESLVADKSDLDAQDSLGTTPLIYASLQGHEMIVEMLLNAGANPNIICSRGGTALHRAVMGDYFGIVKLLLARKDINVNALYSSYGHESALQLASEYSHSDVVRELLKRDDIRINELGGGFTALHLAVQYEDAEVVKLLLADPRIDLDARNPGERPVLVSAARYGYDSIVSMLLDAGASIEQGESILDGGGTAILRAIDYNKLSTVQLLYSRGANWDTRDKYNRSLLHGAAVNDRSQILHWLLQTQPAFDVNQQDVNGKTALHDAAFLGYDDCIKILLEFHARTDIRDNGGKTPLRTAKEHSNLSAYALLQAARDEEIKSLQRSGTLVEDIEVPLYTAALTGDCERVQYFIDRSKRASCSSQKTLDQKDDGLERSAIAAAVEGGHDDVIDMLVAAGVDVNLQDRLGRTPLHGCVLYDRYTIAKKLIAANADIDRADQWGMSALSMAQNSDRWEMVVLFLEHGARIKEQEQDLQMLLFQSAYLGNEVVVRRLLGMGADAQRKTGEGMTPLQLARLGEHEETATLLLDWETKVR